MGDPRATVRPLLTEAAKDGKRAHAGNTGGRAPEKPEGTALK
jgi:hypothetical protein